MTSCLGSRDDEICAATGSGAPHWKQKSIIITKGILTRLIRKERERSRSRKKRKPKADQGWNKWPWHLRTVKAHNGLIWTTNKLEKLTEMNVFLDSLQHSKTKSGESENPEQANNK